MMEEALNFVAEAFATSFQDAANTIENVKLDTMNIYQEYEPPYGYVVYNYLVWFISVGY